ncbi:four helix bundle protein [Acidipila sp. 4G-K13]|uniref:Four helix bundle protein n=1 Tax=Paracidobacterium acidisoli TaxID=2303751 RepID=A0A372IRW1_9BACT|nr:four helix bundle protein [Paracidobacterium acidisoli]
MTVAIYQLTAEFQREELYSLVSQLRHAGISTASNIAEGWGRNTTGEYRHFLGMARGSNFEIQTQLVIARELGYGGREKMMRAEELSPEVGKMLVVMMKKLETTRSSPTSNHFS